MSAFVPGAIYPLEAFVAKKGVDFNTESSLYTNQFVVVGVRSDPKPDVIAIPFHRNSSVTHTDPH